LKNVLITGALGQDGLILSKLFLKKRFKVFGFIKKSNKSKINRVKYKINDLKNKKKLKKDFKEINPNIVIHLASSNNSYIHRKEKDSFKINYLQNIICMKNLLNAIKENNLKTKLVFAGSSLMFKGNLKKKITEKDKFSSSEYYGKYKIDSYKLISKLNYSNKINASTAILFNHDSTFRNKKFLIPRLIKLFKERKLNSIEQIYNLNISGDFSHAEDICYGIYKLSITKKKIDKIILSSGERFYINDIIDYLEKKFNLQIRKDKIKDNSNFQPLGSNLVARKLLNYKVKKTPIDACNELIKIICKA
jgi:GDPmannose 4,6-dehydratase|tara:strand:+ start:491 stop:1408 length:918 start_codon:yes stop_codon:yes gene_type:complete